METKETDQHFLIDFNHLCSDKVPQCAQIQKYLHKKRRTMKNEALKLIKR